jgi:hypothetical protein
MTMSWIRLLNTSRSFSGQDVEPRGYRLTQMNFIPKFGNPGGVPSVSNPGALTSRPARAASAAAATRKIATVAPLPRGTPAPEPASAQAPTPTPKSATTLITIAELGSSVRSGSAKLAGALGAAAGATVEFCGRLVRRREEQPFAAVRAEQLAADARPAQPELRLEAIRPVHNDLSDCDYEVRPVRRAAPPAGAEAELPPARDSGVFALAGDAVERVRTLFH